MTDRAVSTRPRRHIRRCRSARPCAHSLLSPPARAARRSVAGRACSTPPPPRSPHASRELAAARARRPSSAQEEARAGRGAMARWAGVAGSKGSGRRPGRLYRRQRGGRLSRNIPCRDGSLARATVCNDAVRRRCAVPDRGGGARSPARRPSHPPDGRRRARGPGPAHS